MTYAKVTLKEDHQSWAVMGVVDTHIGDHFVISDLWAKLSNALQIRLVLLSNKAKHTGFRQITEVNQRLRWSILKWVTN